MISEKKENARTKNRRTKKKKRIIKTTLTLALANCVRRGEGGTTEIYEKKGRNVEKIRNKIDK